MYPLLESLAIHDGKVQNLSWHEKRYNASFKELFGKVPKLELLDDIDIQLPSKGLYKLRIAYCDKQKDVEITPYLRKPITTFKVVETQQLDYHLKYANREKINELFALRQDCDDVLIINNGLVSDSSIGNIIFLNHGKWFTPNSPLLEGTQRAKLFNEGIIRERTITQADLKTFEAFQVVNAMRPFDDQHKLSITNIIF